MVKRILVILCTILLFVSCGPTKFVPKSREPIKFESTPKYELNLDEITKPDKPKYILMDEDFNIIEDIKEAKYVVYTKEEFAKVVAHLEVRKAYKDIAKEQELLINNYIKIINSLKEYVALEQEKAKEYRELWADSENAYRQERYDHKIDNLFHRSIIGSMGIGAIVIAILAL
ncbi:MAG: hypothetical protein PVG65_04460 [Candidatus Thorarchaeota archaeon]|jgi:hypothetical protein